MLEVPEVMRCVLPRLLEALKVLEVEVEVAEVMCYVLLCSPEVLKVLEVAEVMQCVLLCLLQVVEVAEVMRRVAALYARGCGG